MFSSHIKYILGTGFLILGLAIVAPSAFAISLGVAGDYNAFIFGDFTSQNSDIEGRLAAGGNATLTNYTVGSNLDPKGTKNALVVGGNLIYDGGEIQNGNAVVRGQASGANARDGKVYDQSTSLPFDFAAEETYLQNLSRELATMTANGKAQNNYGGTYLTTDSTSMMQVFDIDGSDLTSSTYLTFMNNQADIPENATFVFNISGTDNAMTNMGMQSFVDALGSSYDNVLFNFYEATALTLSGISIKGSILAPLADVTGNNGNIDGTIIAKSWTGGMELHNLPFDGTNPVPEPGTLALFSVGLIGLAGLGRCRRK